MVNATVNLTVQTRRSWFWVFVCKVCLAMANVAVSRAIRVKIGDGPWQRCDLVLTMGGSTGASEAAENAVRAMVNEVKPDALR